MRAFRYIFSDLIPVFFLGIFVFIFILLMFQALRLTEFVLVHGVKLETVLSLTMYMSISFLPAILPMSLLFAVLMTYGRLSVDSEIIALKSIGIGMQSLTMPAIVFGLIIAAVSAKTCFDLAPWGNRQFEVLINKIGQKQATISIREGTFSEGFFDLVIYANRVDSTTGRLSEVFIYDERNPKVPLTIIARRGQIIVEEDQTDAYAGNYALMRLQDGSMHRKTESHTRIKFESYDLKLSETVRFKEKQKSLQSMTFAELSKKLSSTKPPGKKASKKERKNRWKLEAEYQKRMAIAVACFVFALIGVGFGAVTNKRNAKSGGFILSVILIVSYWILYVSLESASRQGQVPAHVALWIPNGIFSMIGLYKLRQNWN